MGRSPCRDEPAGLTKGHWTPEEDRKLEDYILKHGHGNWKALPKHAGLNRCGKSCRLRWTNYLRPDIKRGAFTEKEEEQIIQLHAKLGNKWSAIAAKLPGRTDNEIKNFWNTHLRKKLLHMGIDPMTHQPRADLTFLASIPSLLASLGCGLRPPSPLDNALRLQADVARLAKIQLIQCLVQLISPAPNGGSTTPLTTTASSGDLYQQQQQLLINDHQNLNQFQAHHHLCLHKHQQLLHAPTTATSSSQLSDMGGAADVDPSHFLQNYLNECSPAVNWVEGGDDHHIMSQVLDGPFPINPDQFGYENGTSGSSCSNPTSKSTPSLNHDNLLGDQMQDYHYLQSFHSSTTATSSANVDFHHWNEGGAILPQSSSVLHTWPGAGHKGDHS